VSAATAGGTPREETLPALVLDGVGVRFGDLQALRDISLTVPAGAFTAIVGPNGSGKSTFIKVLLGLVPTSAGRVCVLGEPPGAVPPAWIGYVPQVKTLDRSFPARSLELVITGLRPRWPWLSRGREREEALAALERVGAQHVAQRAVAQLSGGELQRVYLARSLARRPRIVMLDEPATGIDVVGEKDMYSLLEAFQRETGATILMVTHDLAAAHHHASHVLVLNRRQIAFGPPEAALSEDCLRQAYSHVGHAHPVQLGAHV
jgi:zinc transport system ATP-binding protein